jgi:hypothetical protein
LTAAVTGDIWGIKGALLFFRKPEGIVVRMPGSSIVAPEKADTGELLAFDLGMWEGECGASEDTKFPVFRSTHHVNMFDRGSCARRYLVEPRIGRQSFLISWRYYGLHRRGKPYKAL